MVVGGAAFLGLATLFGVRAMDLRAQRAQLLASGDRRAKSLAVVFAGYLSQTFAAFDASLRQLALHSQRIGGANASDADWGPALAAARTALAAVGSISVVDTTGIVRHSTQALIVGQSRRDSYVFRRLSRDTTDDLVADPPFRALTRERPYLIPLGRRVPGPNGRFGGIIVATFLPLDLREVFRAADVGEQGMVSVFHRDGFVVLREPSQENPIGEVAARLPLFEAAAHTDSNSVFRGRALAKGPMLRTAYRPMPDKDLIVAVSLSEDELLREWRRDVTIAIGVGLLFTFALAAILFLVFREMDMRVAAEETLSRSQRLESIGRLTGGIAHDFNNLLTVILGNVALLRDGLGAGPPSAASTAESAAQIERAASRGSALVRQLLAFGRRRPLQSRTVDLGALVRDAIPMLDRTLGEDIALEPRIPAGPAFLATVDPTGLESALLNLCINARDAMPNGGKIIVELSRVTIGANDSRKVTDVTPGEYVTLNVIDAGTGIPAEHLPHLFEPFFTTKDVGQGTGLGLSMVYGFVKQSGGTVKVESSVGRGTVVTLYLPEAHDADALSPVVREEPLAAADGEVILLVEDEPDLLQLAAGFLRTMGYRVIEATSGPAAIAAARDEPRIDLVVTDIVMPGGMSGKDVARAMREQRPDVRVLYVSGYPGDSDEVDDEDAASIVAKPYDRTTLAAGVRDALRARAH